MHKHQSKGHITPRIAITLLAERQSSAVRTEIRLEYMYALDHADRRYFRAETIFDKFSGRNLSQDNSSA